VSTVILVGVADNVQSYNRKRHVNSNLNPATQSSNHGKLLMNEKKLKAWTLFLTLTIQQ